MRRFLLLIGIFFFLPGFSQQIDSARQQSDGYLKDQLAHPSFKNFIVPVSLIALGSLDRSIDGLKKIDANIQSTIKGSRTTKVDDYLQYSPLAAIFVLKAAGVKSRSSFSDQWKICGISLVSTAIMVGALKKITGERRPDGSSTESFPSGHTALAFTGAEMLFQEYRNTSKFIGYTGYAAATATGILRMYNNKHWLGDVIAGAGFGILSAKLAYWLEPKIFHAKKRK
jgi:hypothetical protein